MNLRRDERGISLIEVLAAVTVFALVAAGVAASTISTTRGNNTSRKTTTAAALIQDKIEQLRALNPDAKPAALNPGSYSDAANPINELGQAGGIFTRTWTITDKVPVPDMSELVVTVTWKDPEARTLRASTFLCKSSTCS
jgi:prepilin-type N-terminal cleavage/methylation domain-containing protein